MYTVNGVTNVIYSKKNESPTATHDNYVSQLASSLSSTSNKL